MYLKEAEENNSVAESIKKNNEFFNKNFFRFKKTLGISLKLENKNNFPITEQNNKKWLSNPL